MSCTRDRRRIARMFRRRDAVVVLLAANVLAPSLSAQWPAFPTPNVPKTADGKPNLLAPAPRTRDGKPDLSGIWENPGWRNLGNGVSGTGGSPGTPAVLPRGPGLFFDIGSGVPGEPPVPLTPLPRFRQPGFSQMPERSGFPSRVRGVGPRRLGLPSAVFGTFGVGNDGHCADSDGASTFAATRTITAAACRDIRAILRRSLVQDTEKALCVSLHLCSRAISASSAPIICRLP